MDVGLRREVDGSTGQVVIVSILVLVDVGLRPDPMSNVAIILLCFNPCFSGCWSATTVVLRVQALWMLVSILVLVDVGLRLFSH